MNQKELAYQSAVDECFQSVSEGKALVADAITDKGVSTSSTASFSTMATNIRNIVARFSALSNQASASQILSGRAAYDGIGSVISGTHTCPTVSGSNLRWYTTSITSSDADGGRVNVTLQVSNPTIFICYCTNGSDGCTSSCGRLGSFYWRTIHGGSIGISGLSEVTVSGTTMTIKSGWRNNFFPESTVNIRYAA